MPNLYSKCYGSSDNKDGAGSGSGSGSGSASGRGRHGSSGGGKRGKSGSPNKKKTKRRMRKGAAEEPAIPEGVEIVDYSKGIYIDTSPTDTNTPRPGTPRGDGGRVFVSVPLVSI